MSYPGASFPHPITYNRKGSTKVEALLHRLGAVEDALHDAGATPDDIARTRATLGHDMRAAKRAFTANDRALVTIDNLINQLY